MIAQERPSTLGHVFGDRGLADIDAELEELTVDALARYRVSDKTPLFADKISNLRAIAASAPSDWSVKRRLEYVRWAREVAKGLRGANQKLEEQFDNVAAVAERSFKPAI